MSKAAAILFSLFLIAVTFISFSVDMQWIMTVTNSFTLFRLCLALSIVTILFITDQLLLLPARLIITVVSGCMLVMALSGLFDVELLGLSGLYLRPLDIFIFVEAGIMGLIAAMGDTPRIESAEQPALSVLQTNVSLENNAREALPAYGVKAAP